MALYQTRRPSFLGPSPFKETLQFVGGGKQAPYKPPPPYANVKRKPVPQEPVTNESNNSFQRTISELQLEWQRLIKAIEAEAAEKTEQLARLRKLREEAAERGEGPRQQASAEVIAKVVSPRDAWDTYMRCWRTLSSRSSPPSLLRLSDIPWPVMPVFLEVPDSTIDVSNELENLLTLDAISEFLFSTHHSGKKNRKQRLREALLIYHPDKFNGRFLEKAPETHGEKESVRKAVGYLVQILAELLEKEP